MDAAVALYDRRQLSIMKNRIEDLVAGDLSYGRLYSFVSDIEALVNCIQESTEDWKDTVNTSAYRIDVICGLMNMDGRSAVNERERNNILNEYLPKISQMIEEYEKQLPEVLDESLLDE